MLQRLKKNIVKGVTDVLLGLPVCHARQCSIIIFESSCMKTSFERLL